MNKVVSLIKDFLPAIIVTVVSVAAIVLIYTFVGGPMAIEGSSMEPVLLDGDIVIINRLAYSYDNEPQRYDLIAFEYSEDSSRKFVKRIIGMPGDVIKIEDDVVYVDYGEGFVKLGEYYGYFEGEGNANLSNYGPVTLSEGEYFVLGDNRYLSKDSRFQDIGLVNADQIIGKVTFRIFPLSGFGSLNYE